MKTKITYCIASFVTALALALTFVTINKNFYFPKKNDTQAREKIYEFLLKDQQINLESYEKSKADETGKVLEIWKQYKELKFKLDTSDLPEDFRNAWEKRISSDIDWINFFYYFRKSNSQMILKTDAQIEIFEQKDAEYRRACREFDQIIESYGIGYDKNGELIKK